MTAARQLYLVFTTLSVERPVAVILQIAIERKHDVLHAACLRYSEPSDTVPVAFVSFSNRMVKRHNCYQYFCLFPRHYHYCNSIIPATAMKRKKVLKMNN
jgi:hypothetical protein